ncbi:putative Tic20 family protein [Nonlabens xylanidelens]|uniref:Putative Tic20 family protein n=1 Tax=Nonlabens xylanidelens TaxID=191564 RepID=A0A2S6IS28_9FLAO|nr:helix-turn-helix domain-containing protein [Nonlabens xylanidelens]PPK97073.1 putative Tic20 family protein [Nonlabens xylanidelens]
MMSPIGTKIKEIRLKKGMSQEELATESQVSLRTIQRIENNENEPRGKTMQLICETLAINIEELLDYGKYEDRQFLMFFHLSVIAGIFIPIGNIILPLILWLTKKDKVQGLQKVGARLLNFQIVFQAFGFVFFMSAVILKILHKEVFLISNGLEIVLALGVLNGIAAIIFAMLNHRGKQITYPSIIPMIK